jgi:hypothetical protein
MLTYRPKPTPSHSFLPVSKRSGVPAVCIGLLFLFHFITLNGFSQISFNHSFGELNCHEIGVDVRQTDDDGYIVLGTNFGPFGPSVPSMQLFRLDANGNELWSKGGNFFTDYSLYESRGEALIITSDSGFLVTGSSSNLNGNLGVRDAFLLKTDQNGVQEWVMTYDSLQANPAFGTYSEDGSDVIESTDGGYVVSANGGNDEILLIKTDLSGNILWMGSDTGLYEAHSVALIEVENNQYLVVGITHASVWGEPLAYLAKFDASGNKIWGQSYSWAGGTNAVTYTVVMNQEGNYNIAGVGRFDGQQYGDMILLELDTAGNLLWEASYPFGHNSLIEGICTTSTGGFAATGFNFDSVTTSYSVQLLCTDNAGTLIYDTAFVGDVGAAVQQTSDDGFVITCTNYSDIGVIKVPPLSTGISDKLNLSVDFAVYPNPSSGTANIRLDGTEAEPYQLEVFNGLGQLVALRSRLYAGKTYQLNTATYSSGIYTIRIVTTNHQIYSKKLLVR